MSTYNNSMHLTENSYLTLRYVGDMATDRTRQFTIILESKAGDTRIEQFIDLPEGRLVDMQNLIEEGLKND